MACGFEVVEQGVKAFSVELYTKYCGVFFKGFLDLFDGLFGDVGGAYDDELLFGCEDHRERMDTEVLKVVIDLISIWKSNNVLKNIRFFREWV